jgi:dihydrofolate reductase
VGVLLGALVCGRTLFDVAEGWQGRHTLDVPVVVVTHHVPTDWVDAHPDAPFSFVTDGVEAAVARAQELAGDLVSRSPEARSPVSAWTWGCSTRWPSTWFRS